ncbi:hypothetical protein [Companilactobacillus ginsenosidimutans]|uniref:Uncharacterized protein n=1 Tax=Companilactobacillus ginsenosidimutans TaxID=1007676 RepID=A0A0H4QLP1_9LACO|nr:hypothetical protein [Companilactobacillus ginsenosidimutans]AKP67608.1 hypothetical protein ABM34_08740 [Companilactobacillus ginsenosidimutans]
MKIDIKRYLTNTIYTEDDFGKFLYDSRFDENQLIDSLLKHGISPHSESSSIQDSEQWKNAIINLESSKDSTLDLFENTIQECKQQIRYSMIDDFLLGRRSSNSASFDFIKALVRIIISVVLTGGIAFSLSSIKFIKLNSFSIIFFGTIILSFLIVNVITGVEGRTFSTQVKLNKLSLILKIARKNRKTK